MATLDPFERLSRARAAAGGHPDLLWVLNTIDAWTAHAVADGRQRPLQRYLGMGTPAQMKRYLRDRALIEASTHLGVTGSPWVLAQELERAWHRFAACPAWVADIEHRREPPPELDSRLRRALWAAIKYSDGRLLDVRQLCNILRAVPSGPRNARGSIP
jgi:hypothetical protein